MAQKLGIKNNRGVKLRTFKRICIKTSTVTAKNGESCTIERGKEYLTSDEKSGKVTVFTNYWVPFSVELFAGEEKFT